jgi:hypothetical protein
LLNIPEAFKIFLKHPKPFYPVAHLKNDIAVFDEVKTEIRNNLDQRMAIPENNYKAAAEYLAVFNDTQPTPGTIFTYLMPGVITIK